MNKLSFEQVRQLIYDYYMSGLPDEWLGEHGERDELLQAENIDELVDILDGLGYNKDEAYYFIFEAIIEN